MHRSMFLVANTEIESCFRPRSLSCGYAQHTHQGPDQAMPIRLLTALLFMTLCSACNSGIYLHDGVTDGDTFYLAERALTDSDPVLQSWVSYSLAKSACQLQIGGENPARANSYECELTARRLLLDTWSEKQAEEPGIADPYLDELSIVRMTGYLPEYVARYFGKSEWSIPEEIEMQKFNKWRRKNIPGHRPKTVLTGSWNYASRITNY